jgi:hypothetical protein
MQSHGAERRYCLTVMVVRHDEDSAEVIVEDQKARLQRRLITGST